ncbi:XkdX family protein [Paenibacillus harenae]|nr:XkdX family protein [Paenibacillus harenae]
MDWFTIVKRHYDAGRYLNSDVMKFVTAGKITNEQYTEITGQAV